MVGVGYFVWGVWFVCGYGALHFMNTISLTIQLTNDNPDAAITQALVDLLDYIITHKPEPIPALVILSDTNYRLRMDKIKIKDKGKK